jgi:hypothetical protein
VERSLHFAEISTIFDFKKLSTHPKIDFLCKARARDNVVLKGHGFSRAINSEEERGFSP